MSKARPIASKRRPTSVETMPEGCRRELFTVPSRAMGREIRAAVVLPPAALGKKGKRCPALYALHGHSAPYLTFSEMAPLRKYLLDHPMILFCFDGDKDSSYVDATHRQHSLFTTFFFKELIPYIEKHYPTDGRRAVTGFSMGGYGAFHYLLTKPGAFVSVGALSGAFDKFRPNRRGLLERIRVGDEALFGPYAKNPKAYAGAAIHSRLEAWFEAGKRLPPLQILCGVEDFLLESNRNLVKFIAGKNAGALKKIAARTAKVSDPQRKRRLETDLRQNHLIDFEYVETPGAHDWPYWCGISRRVAQFHWEKFQA